MSSQDPPIAQELLSHQTFLRRLAIDLVGEDADDLVQEVWRRTLEHPPHHGRQLRGWLARIARNLAADRWRGESRRRSREEHSASERPPGDELEARLELRKELVEALDSLSQSCRETILLRYFEGLAPREIARRQRTPVATVKTRLRRGLARLREALDERCGGDRATWMSAVAALGAPSGGGAGTGTLVIGGMAMGTMTKVSAAVLVAAACVYFVVRTPPAGSPRMAAVEPMPADVELVDVADVTAAEDPAAVSAAGAVRRTRVAEEPPGGVSPVAGTNVLRVVLEGITEEDARMATVTLRGVDERDGRPEEIGASWPCQGLTSEFALDPVLATVERLENLRVDELEVEVDHPHLLGERTRVSVARDEEPTSGMTVHEVRVRMVRPGFWPEFTLDVRDAHTRAHLEDVELRILPDGTTFWGRNPTSTLLGDGLRSPIALMGGRDADEPEVTVAGLALSPAAGESPRLVQFPRRFPPERGVTVSARAPGYAWGSTSLDVSKGERELLLEPAAALDLQLANVQLERYAALETVPMLCVYRQYPNGDVGYVRFEPLDETLETDGLRLDGLVPGEYRVTFELGGGSWTEQPVLAREEVSIVAGETLAVVLVLDEPPAPPARATLGGVISFPAFGGEERVRLQLYFQPTQRWMIPDFEFSLADLQPVGGALRAWSFRVEDLPVGMYRVQVFPFLKVWMIDLQAGGAEDLDLVLPELAEVLVETVDGRTGERVPLGDLYYRNQEPVPGQLQNDLARADTEEPGRFHFWATPGTVRVWPGFPNGSEREFGGSGEDLELVPGLQSVRFELPPVYAMHFEFHEDGTALPIGPQGLLTIRDIRAVDHEGRVTGGGLQRDMRVEVSAPGVYEIDFEGVTGDRYHPIPPRRVDVHAGETTEVIVELRRK